jgi:asparagine synthase (glutamine-hydrolysing)
MDQTKILHDALQKGCSEAHIGGVALSGGLDSTVISHMLRDRHLPAIAVISRDFVATDLTYCQAAAAATNMRLNVVMPNTTELLEGVSETVRILGCFGESTIRNALVMYMTISEAKKIGIDSLVTGDGADELFAGYGFLVRMDPDMLREELDRLRGIMRFSSHTIGKSLGVRIESPFLHSDVVRVASGLPPGQLVGEYGGARVGKMILRRLFEGKIPQTIVRRPKSPMQDGAGTAGLKDLLESLITDDLFAERAGEILERDGIRIRTKESLHYYEQYLRHFGPPKPARGGLACTDCRCTLHPNLRSCRMCGAFPV